MYDDMQAVNQKTACEFLGISRSLFRKLVAEDKISKGFLIADGRPKTRRWLIQELRDYTAAQFRKGMGIKPKSIN